MATYDYANKRIIYPNDEGGVSILIPAPDCELSLEQIAGKDVPAGKPYQIVDGTLVKWLSYYTDDDNVMITSDKIVTIVDPKQSLFDDYSALIK